MPLAFELLGKWGGNPRLLLTNFTRNDCAAMTYNSSRNFAKSSMKILQVPHRKSYHSHLRGLWCVSSS